MVVLEYLKLKISLMNQPNSIPELISIAAFSQDK
jgi:hypothetical protein